jgi:hypothetical protein
MISAVTSRASFAASRSSRTRLQLATALIGASIALLAALPATASAANDTTCGGSTKLGDSGLGSNDVEYAFGCSATIKSFAVITNTSVSVFGTDAKVFDPKTNLNVDKQSFDCAGTIPGVGASCLGTATGGNRIRGNLGLAKSACQGARFWLVVSDATGSVAGPFQLGQPKGCVAKRAQDDRKHSKRKRSRRTRR